MRVLDPGHAYELFALDVPPRPWAEPGEDPSVHAQEAYAYNFNYPGASQVLTFVKRVGDDYPGNADAYPGTTTQDVLRALIDRTLYVNEQRPDVLNYKAVDAMRYAIRLFEQRNAEAKGLVPQFREKVDSTVFIERIPTCVHCNHIVCKEFVGEEEKAPNYT